MALKTFHPGFFAPEGFEADIEGRALSGGTSLSNQTDRIRSDGGGLVFIEIADPFLDEPEEALAWRAVSAYLDGGAQPIIVVICDGRHQPTNGPVTVPHSDGSPFSDGSEYEQSDSEVTVAAAAVLRATTVSFDIVTIPRALLGGEWFSIEHPTQGWRAYRIAEIDTQDSTAATVRFRPPLREALTGGEPVEFMAPRCVMTLEGDMRSASRLGFAESQGARFVEHFPRTGGYE